MAARDATLRRCEATPAEEPARPVSSYARAVKSEVSSPLGASERMFAALHRATATNVTRVLLLEGTLRPAELERALRVLQSRHPLLRARIRDGQRPYFVHDQAAP